MAINKQMNYQALSEELDSILEQLQSGELDIDEALNKYQRGIEIAGQLQLYLKKSSNKVKLIKKQFGAK